MDAPAHPAEPRALDAFAARDQLVAAGFSQAQAEAQVRANEAQARANEAQARAVAETTARNEVAEMKIRIANFETRIIRWVVGTALAIGVIVVNLGVAILSRLPPL